jgi:hypothetical protein
MLNMMMRPSLWQAHAQLSWFHRALTPPNSLMSSHLSDVISSRKIFAFGYFANNLMAVPGTDIMKLSIVGSRL